MSSNDKFQLAVKCVNELTYRPTDEELLCLYSLYKQITVGNVNTSRPGLLKFKEKAKWDAWKSLENSDNEKNIIKYIDLAYKLTKNELLK